MATVATPTGVATGDDGPRTGAVRLVGFTVFYDPTCELCRRCRAWLEVQPTYAPLRFRPADVAEARRLLPEVPWLGTELVVIRDDGAVWIGPAAFLTCLWATRQYRGWSRRLSGPAFAPMAERFFEAVSSNRGKIGAFASRGDCDDGTCRHHVDPSLGLPPTSCDPRW